MKIDELLKNYRRNKGTIEILKLNVKTYELNLKKDALEINDLLTKPSYENLGIDKGTRKSNPTEEIVIRAEKEKEVYEQKIKILQEKINTLEYEQTIVENLIETLDEESKMLITQRIFENTKWNIVTYKFNAEFRNEYKEYITISGIRKKYYRILEHLSNLFQENGK